jgi:hypothetical protein
MSMTVPASAHVVDSATAAPPAVLGSGPGALSSQPGTSADNIVWGTSSDDGGCGIFPDGTNVTWQSSVDVGDTNSGTSLNPLLF